MVLAGTQSWLADLFTTAAVRVACPNVAAGEAAQASFDRKLSHYRQEIPDFRNQGIHCRSLSGQQMGDRTPPSLEPCSVQQTSRPATTANTCQQNAYSGNMKFR